MRSLTDTCFKDILKFNQNHSRVVMRELWKANYQKHAIIAYLKGTFEFPPNSQLFLGLCCKLPVKTTLPHVDHNQSASSLALSKRCRCRNMSVCPAPLYRSKILRTGSFKVVWINLSRVFTQANNNYQAPPFKFFFLFFFLLGLILPVGCDSKGCSPSRHVSQI